MNLARGQLEGRFISNANESQLQETRVGGYPFAFFLGGSVVHSRSRDVRLTEVSPAGSQHRFTDITRPLPPFICNDSQKIVVPLGSVVMNVTLPQGYYYFFKQLLMNFSTLRQRQPPLPPLRKFHWRNTCPS